MKNKLSLYEQAVVIGLWRQGATFYDIADELGCHQWLAVKCILNYLETKRGN